MQCNHTSDMTSSSFFHKQRCCVSTSFNQTNTSEKMTDSISVPRRRPRTTTATFAFSTPSPFFSSSSRSNTFSFFSFTCQRLQQQHQSRFRSVFTSIRAVSTEPSTSGKETITLSPPQSSPLITDDEDTSRMFSNITTTSDGTFKRDTPSELACTALVAGTMIGAGVLALPTVAAPSGFVPSTATLLAIWGYMSATGLLISEVTINTACSLGRANGISMLSLGNLTLGRFGGILTASSYVLLHYAILTAYTAQGGHILQSFLDQHFATLTAFVSSAPPLLYGALFASIVGIPMLLFPRAIVARLNNVAVAAAIGAFFAVLFGTNVLSTSSSSSSSTTTLFTNGHWNAIGQMIPVAFVSCVYHNVVSSITMRLEGDRKKIRRAILLGSGIPVAMFILYDFVMLSSSSSTSSESAIALFSTLAIGTSFVGFVEGLTELFADVRETLVGLKGNVGRVADFALTLIPPVAIAATSPDVFLNALDVAGTYGIAVLFGLIPASMSVKTRSSKGTKEFDKLVPGGNVALAAIAGVPVALIASRVWSILHSYHGVG